MTYAPLSKNINNKYYLLLLLYFLKPQLGLAQNDVISFTFEDKNLKLALKQLIENDNLNIIFPEEVNKTLITTSCYECSEKDALDSILHKTKYKWLRREKQYTIYESDLIINYKLSGQVFDDKTRESIAFANVYIPKLKIGDVTEYDGTFTLPSIDIHNCKLIISYIGYESKVIEINFPRKDTPLNILLSPNIIISNGISIIGSNLKFMEKSQTPGQITFSPRFISSLPNLGEVDIFRSLQLLPGIQLGLGGTSNLSIKGSKPEQNLILLDGMPIYQSNHMYGFISGINSNAIKDVQVFNGNIPAKYGNLTSSVVELTTKRGNSLKTHANYQRNFISNSFSIETPILSKGSFIFNQRNSNKIKYRSSLHDEIYNFKTGDDQFNLIQESIEPVTNQRVLYNPQASFSDVISRISFLFTPKHNIAITNLYAIDSTRENRLFFGFKSILGYDSTKVIEGRRKENKGTSINISSNWNYKINSQLILSKSQLFNSYKSEQFMIDLDNNLATLGTASDANNFSDISKKLHITFKGLKNNKLNLGLEQSKYYTLIEEKKLDGFNSDQLIYNKKATVNSIYIQNQLKIIKNLSVQAGFRIEYFLIKKRYLKSPRFSFIYNLNSNLSYEASFGKFHQLIHHLPKVNSNKENDFYWIFSSNKIPEISSFNFHHDINFNKKDYTFRAGIYKKSLEKVFKFYDSPSQYLLESSLLDSSIVNEGIGSSKGFEILIRKREGKVTGWSSYHINRTDFNFSNLNQGLSFLGDLDKTHEVKAVLITKLKSFNLTANWVFSSGRVFTDLKNMSIVSGFKIIINQNENKERLPFVHHLDISISKQYDLKSIKAQIGFSIYNIYNKNNISHKRYNPYNDDLTMKNITTFGITPSGFIKIHF